MNANNGVPRTPASAGGATEEPTRAWPLGKTVGAAALLVLPIAVGITLVGAWYDRLPPELPSHWGTSGPADDFSGTPTMTAVTLGIAALAVVAGLLALLLPTRIGERARAATVGILASAAALCVGIWALSAWLVLDQGFPRTAADLAATELPFWAFMALSLGMMAYGLLPYALLPKEPLPISEGEEELRSLVTELGETERVSWSRTITSQMFLVLSAVMLAVAAGTVVLVLISGAAEGLIVAATLGAAFLLVVSFARFRVTVDWRGLEVRSWLFRIPLKRIRPEQVAGVQGTSLVPMEWGGWGYRVLPGKSAIILRSGPGLVVNLASGKQFALTLDDPEEPAALLLRLSERAQAPGQD